jgi:hypothetical protein
MNKLDLTEENKLRMVIRGAIKLKLNKKKLEEQQLRKVVRHYISEAKEIDADGNPTPYNSTALVALADAFNEILKTIKDGLRGLQKPEERASYRLNILEKFKNFFKKAEGFDSSNDGLVGESDVDEQELEVKIDNRPDDALVMPSDQSEDGRFKEREKSDEEKSDEAFETERVEGQDATGAIWAFDVWNNSNIESTLSDKRKLLPSEEYRQEFKEYCLYNIDLWMSFYEKDIAEEKSQVAAFTEPVMPRPAGAQVSPMAASLGESDIGLDEIFVDGMLEEL